MSEHVTSVDPKEVAYYERLASTWWDRTGPFWPLHKLNELRVAYIRDQLCSRYGLDSGARKPLQGLEVLDVGCGGGILSEAMARLGARVHGIDVVARNIEVARRHALRSAVPVIYEPLAVETLAARGASYDVVLSMEVVEHVADLAGFVEACARTVREDGVIFVATINRTLRSWLFAIVGAEYVLGWLPRGTHSWSKFPKPHELERLLNGTGLEIAARSGVKVNPVTRRFGLTSEMAVNYMLMASRGLPSERQAHAAADRQRC